MNLENLLYPIALRRDLHKQFRHLFTKYLPLDAIVYDVGCGQKPFAEFLKGKVKCHIGVDIADGFYKTDQVDLIGTAYDVPATDGVADIVILSQVIEHLESPLKAIREAHRLLRPGGLLFLSFPLLYPLHACPRDYLRFTEFYLSNEIAGDDFAIVDNIRLGGFWYLMGMYSSMYLQEIDRGVLRKTRFVKLISTLIGWICLTLHEAEGAILSAAGKDVAEIRSRWTANYLAVLRRCEER